MAENLIDTEIFRELFSKCTTEVRKFSDNNENISKALEKSLEKTLNKIQSGKASPALLPLIVAQDLEYKNLSLAIDICVICAFFHTAADLTDDIEDQDQKNDLINSLGAYQSINIANMLLFISLNLICSLKVSDKSRLKLLNMFSKTGFEMSIGQFYDIAYTKKTEFFDPVQIAENKAAKEIACFIAAFPVAAETDEKPFYDLGFYYGILAQVFSDYFDIWGNPVSDDLVSLKKSLPVHSAISDETYSKKIRIFLSGKNDLNSKQFELRRLLTRTRAVEALEALVQDYNTDITDIFTNINSKGKLYKIVFELITNCQIMVSTLKEIRELTEKDTFDNTVDFSGAIDAGLDFLQQIKDFPDTWEIQRSSFLGEKKLDGNLFTPSIILETLNENNIDVTRELTGLLQLKKNNGWHYYTNTTKIPTDSDDLGQLLHLSSKSAIDKGIFKKSLEVLEQNLEDNGRSPTWLADGVEHTKEGIEKTWFGNECVAVMANLYYGLFRYDSEFYRDRILKGIEYLKSSFDSENHKWKSAYYKSDKYSFYLISRLFNEMGVTSEEIEKARNKVVSEQLLNGSWDDSPQETSFALLGLMCFPETDPLVLETGLIYLKDSQGYDGSWEGEDLFICPGKDNRYVYYKNSKVTSAFCVRALIKGKYHLDNTDAWPF